MKKEYALTKIYVDSKTGEYYILFNGKKMVINSKNKKVHKLYKKFKPRPRKGKSEIDYLFKNTLAKNLKSRVGRSYRSGKPHSLSYKTIESELSNLKIAKNDVDKRLRDEEEKFNKLQKDLKEHEEKFKKIQNELDAEKSKKKPTTKKDLLMIKDEENKQKLMIEGIQKDLIVQKTKVNQLSSKGEEIVVNLSEALKYIEREKQKAATKAEDKLREEEVIPLIKKHEEVKKNIKRQNIELVRKDSEILKEKKKKELIEKAVEHDTAIKSNLNKKNLRIYLENFFNKHPKIKNEIKDENKELYGKIFRNNSFIRNETDLGKNLFGEKKTPEIYYKKLKEIFGKKNRTKILDLKKPILNHPEDYPEYHPKNIAIKESIPAIKKMKEEVKEEEYSSPPNEAEGKLSLKGTSDVQLNEIMEGFPSFYGCVSDNNQLHECLSKIKEHFYESPVHSFILRLESSEYPSGHWVAVWIDNETKEICYYNSFGEPMPKHIHEEIKEMVDNVEPRFHFDWEYNKNQIQPDHSDLCGLYSTRFLTFMYYDTPFLEACGYIHKNIDKELHGAEHLLELDR